MALDTITPAAKAVFSESLDELSFLNFQVRRLRNYDLADFGFSCAALALFSTRAIQRAWWNG